MELRSLGEPLCQDPDDWSLREEDPETRNPHAAAVVSSSFFLTM
jgi:hypothetical protein